MELDLNNYISEYFKIYDLVKSDIAIRSGIPNIPNAAQLKNLIVLAKKLDEIKSLYPSVFITNAFRSEKLNNVIRGSSKTSAHMNGLAADIDIPTGKKYALLDVFLWIRKTMKFDQIILEFHDTRIPSSGWIHFGLKENHSEYRNQSLYTKKFKGKTQCLVYS